MFSSPPHVSRIAALPAAVIVVSSDPGEGVQSTTTDRIQRLPVDVITARWVGDLDGMVERRRVRLLTPYTKTHYFIDRGQRGIVYDFGTRLEEEINRVLKTRPATRVHVVFVPTPRNELFQALLDGRGDIISSNVTITAAHATSVDVTTPGETDVRQILVSGSTRRAIQTTRDVGGWR